MPALLHHAGQIMLEQMVGEAGGHRLEQRDIGRGIDVTGSFARTATSSGSPSAHPPYRDADGTPRYQIAQIQDITESKRSRMELEHAKEAAEAASCAKSEFLATVSHELRTPLNIILGYTSLLRELEFGSLTVQQASALDRVQKGAGELFELISATLDLSRLEAGRIDVTREWVEPERLLREVDAETRELQQKPGINVVWEVAPDLPALHTDPYKLKVVLKNLVGNAIKFTDAGEVTIGAEQCGRELLLSVRDTGVGIAPEALPIIFEPFRQGDGSPTRRHGGVGLGLYIVSRLLDLIGGTLSVQSEVNQGSRFVVRIPVLHTLRAEAVTVENRRSVAA